MIMIELVHGDCLDVMSKMEDESVDLVVTDPPYKLTARGSSGTMGGYWKGSKAKSGKVFEHNNIKPSDYLPELFRIMKEKSIAYVMCNNVNLTDMLNVSQSVGFKFVKTLIWEKGNKICGKYYMGCFEYVILLRKGGDKPINKCGTPDILKLPIKKMKDSDGKNLHDTEKPVSLMQCLVENSSNEGDVVLDPFMGIGSTGVACLNTNRNFIGIELDDKYFEVAQERLGV